ncbi:MAG: AAA family ATPase [Anaerolineales bacterium]
MVTHVLAVVNMKGGVGKTATVVTLAETLAARGLGPVLVIDVDTQASASYCLAGDQQLKELITSGMTIDQFLERRLLKQDAVPFEHFVRRQVSNTTATGRGQLDIALVASSTNLRISERDILHRLTQHGTSLTGIEEKLSNLLAGELLRLGQEFKYIIFDCAPGISPFTTAAVSLANLVIVPTIPDFLSCLGLDAFLHTVIRDMTHLAGRRPPHVLITRSMARSKQGVMSLWNPVRGRSLRTNHHADSEDMVQQLARDGPTKFKVFKTTLDETPAMPVALSLGMKHQVIKNGKQMLVAPTYDQKYPRALFDKLEQLTKEIQEALR